MDGAPIKRICLFAGYDPDGVIDDYVVDYLRELSQYADIYYLADCEMSPEQLTRIDGYTKGAWSERHGNTTSVLFSMASWWVGNDEQYMS